jgi:hypothetical protein
MSSLSKPRPLTRSSSTPDHVQDRVISAITPFFIVDATTNDASAREAARHMLGDYNAATGRELQLAAQVVVFSFAALDCLRCSMTERDMPVEVLLRMRTNAVALNGLCEKSQKALDARQRDRGKGVAFTSNAAQLDEAEFEAAISKARQMVAFARTKLEAHRVGKALAVAKPAVPVGPTLSTLLTGSQQVTPEVLARRKGPEQLWAKELALLSQQTGQTRH